MNLLTKLMALTLLLVTFSCNAQDATLLNKSSVKKLIEHYFSNNTKSNDSPFAYYLEGEFNGDGLTDLIVAFHPKNIPKVTKQIKVFKPWWPYMSDKSLQVKSKPLYTSLVIFNGNSDNNWFSENTRIFVQLAFSGALESSPERVSILKKGTKEHKYIRNTYLPPNATNDIIVIPSDAAIDTYFYWDKDYYKFFVTDEIP